ncbi:MAG TPA: hypothetical protein VMZ53_00085 [Kofleriaceae bacterium]|nr:hypothetical protein [Kofleriaceae bacterium]
MKLITSSLLLVGAVSVGCGGGSKASTLVEVIAKRTDDFPQTHRVVVPLSGRNSLGSSVDELPERRITPRYNDCFFVVEQQAKGVDKITQKFTGSAAVKSEFAAVAASAGGELKSEDEVVVEFNGITVYGGYGVPNLIAPCGKLENGSKIQVITEQIRAASAQVQFSHSFVARIGAGGGASKAQAQVAAGWSESTKGQVLGKDIVLTARVDEVTLTVENANGQPIPDDVETGTAFALPKSINELGVLTVQRNDVPGKSVTIRFQPKLGGNFLVDPKRTSGVPANLCTINEDHALTANQGCVFWLTPGNAALSVSWAIKDGKKLLSATYYRTTMEPARTNVAADELREKLASH